MTIEEFLDMAIDTQNIEIYSFSKDEVVFTGSSDEIEYDDIVNEEVCSWEVNKNLMIFNID